MRDLHRLMGNIQFGVINAHQIGRCPKCGSPVLNDKSFRDENSKEEYYLSGWCQRCLDAHKQNNNGRDLGMRMLLDAIKK